MDFILRYIDLFLGKGVNFFIVLQTFILSLGHMFALIIPMATLPATLMTYGNLSSENEITAMKSSGISLYSMIRPALFLALFLTAALIAYNNFVLPESNHKLQNLIIDITRKKPAIELKENKFIDAFEGHTIYFRHKDDKTGRIREIQIFKEVKGASIPTTIFAEKGKLTYLEKEHILRMELENGEIHSMPVGNDPSTYRRTKFRNYTLNIEDIDRTLKRSEREYRGDREMNIQQMMEKIRKFHDEIRMAESKMTDAANRQVRDVFAFLDADYRNEVTREFPEPQNSNRSRGAPVPQSNERRESPRIVQSVQSRQAQSINQRETMTQKLLESQLKFKETQFRQINRYRVEIHKKFSIPFACIVFILIGSPIAIRMGRSGVNTAVGLSILFFLIYYMCLIGGEKLADRRLISPFFAMWAANIFFGVCALVLIRKSAMEQKLIDWHNLNPLRLFGR
jgi:lipopolysaccharide export system permease protein